MKIDAHNHADWLGFSFGRTIENMDKNGIDKAILLSWECPVDEYDPAANHLYNVEHGDPMSFYHCIAYKNMAQDRFILGYAPDFRRPDAIDKLKAARDLYDVKICGEVKLRAMYDNYDALALFHFCGSVGMPVILHFDYPIAEGQNKYPRPNYWYGGSIETLERVLKACPGTNFLGHAPGFWAHFGSGSQYRITSYPKGKIKSEGRISRLLRKYNNLYCDISGYSGYNALSRDLEFTKRFVAEFNDRIIFARDCYDSYHIDTIESLDLNENIKQKIYRDNIWRILANK